MQKISGFAAVGGGAVPITSAPRARTTMPAPTANEFDVSPNTCVACCKPCRVCLTPITGKCRTDHLFFRLHGMPWKTAYGKPAGWFRCCSPFVFLCTRAFLAVFWLAISVWSLADSCPAEFNESVWNVSGTADSAPQHCALWITKLTHWTLLLELIYLMFAVYATYMAIYDNKVPDGIGKATPWFISVTYALQPMVLIGSLLVFLLFWGLVYEPPLGATSAFTHGANFAVMLIDFLLVRNPLYLSHVLMPMAYAVVYLLFSLLFYAATGDYIYKALDWSNPSDSGRLSGLIVFFGIPILWILLYCVFLGRRCHRVSTSDRLSRNQLPAEVETSEQELSVPSPSV